MNRHLQAARDELDATIDDDQPSRDELADDPAATPARHRGPDGWLTHGPGPLLDELDLDQPDRDRIDRDLDREERNR